MPLYEYECKKCHHRFERLQKFSDPPCEEMPEVRRTDRAGYLGAGSAVQGFGMVRHRLRQEVFGAFFLFQFFQRRFVF